MTQAELDRLVAQIGEEILARTNGRPVPVKAEGLNIPDQVCPGCVQRCPQTCATKSKQIIAAGADRVSASERLTKIDPAIAGLIDHTLLKPDATRDEIRKICREARKYSFASVCVNPYWVPLVAAELGGIAREGVHGGRLPARRQLYRDQSRRSRRRHPRRRAGDRHGDQHRRAARRKSTTRFVKTSRPSSNVSHKGGAIVKVILETALLDDNQKMIACTLSKLAGADFVKTSTGFGPHGATAHDVALMRLRGGAGDGRKGLRRHSHAGRSSAAWPPPARPASAPAPASRSSRRPLPERHVLRAAKIRDPFPRARRAARLPARALPPPPRKRSISIACSATSSTSSRK